MSTLYGKGDRVRVRTITSEMEAVVVSDEVMRDFLYDSAQLCRAVRFDGTLGPVRRYRILGRAREKSAEDR